jgi:hypothetical protein
MNKYLVMSLLVSLGLVSCGVKDEQYYRLNPKALEKAIKDCPNQQPQGLSCPQIVQLGNRLGNLAYQLQSSPQGFGTKILSLQQTIAAQEKELKSKENPELSKSLQVNKADLADFLAVVKWLESPESS